MGPRQWALVACAMMLLAPAAASIGLLEQEAKLPDLAAPLTAPDEDGAPLPRGPDVPGVASSPYMDYDRNRIFDTLDAEMADKPGNWQRDVIALLTEEPTPGKVSELKAYLGGFVINSYKENPWDAEGKPWNIIPAFAAVLTKDQIQQLSRRPDVRHIEPVIEVHTFMNTARDESGVDKAKTDFGVNGDGNGNVKSFAASDIVICVIDTGIYAGHVDLNEGQVIGWKDYINGQTSAYDDNGHGTHVSGIAAGQGDGNSIYRGVAHGAALVGVKVLNSAGSGSSTDITNGINFCKDNESTYGIEIITMSIGGGTCADGSDGMSSAANGAVDAGLVFTIAMGNSGPGYCTVASPGAAEKPIGVGAVSDPDNGACSGYLGRGWYLAHFSSRGKTGDGRYKPNIVAPGVCITAPWRTSSTAYATLSGTSMATPFIAGVAALMLDAKPSLTPAQVKGYIQNKSRDFGPNNQASEPQSYDWGAGVVDAHTSVEAVCGCGSYNAPANPTHFYRGEDLAGTGKKDKYDLAVTGTSRSISITLIIPSASGSKDFDIRLYNPSGSQVASSLGTDRQEEISYAPTVTGTFKIQVESYAGSGSYWMDVTASASSLTLVQDQ